MGRGRLHRADAVHHLEAGDRVQAGRFGTFVLFFVLAFGILGFVAKSVIQWLLKL